MNFWKVCEICFIVVTLASIGAAEKRDPEKMRHILYWAFVGSVGCALPLACIETLSAFGFQFFDVNWAFTPLDGMFCMCAVSLVVMSGRKLFGIIDTSK